MSNVTIWADGYGRWHAEVDDTPRGLTMATYEIAQALHERADKDAYFSKSLTYVEENIVSLPSETPGRIHFAEYEV